MIEEPIHDRSAGLHGRSQLVAANRLGHRRPAVTDDLRYLQAASVLGLGIVLWKVRPKVAVRDRARQRVDECMTHHVAVRVRVEADHRRHKHATEHKRLALNQSMHVVPQPTRNGIRIPPPSRRTVTPVLNRVIGRSPPS